MIIGHLATIGLCVQQVRISKALKRIDLSRVEVVKASLDLTGKILKLIKED